MLPTIGLVAGLVVLYYFGKYIIKNFKKNSLQSEIDDVKLESEEADLEFTLDDAAQKLREKLDSRKSND